MNAYTTTGQARSQPRDMAAVRPANRLMVGGSLTGLEWQRDCHAEAEIDRLLKHNGVTPQVSASRVALLRQTIGAILVHAGERLAGGPRRGASLDTAPAADTLSTVG